MLKHVLQQLFCLFFKRNSNNKKRKHSLSMSLCYQQLHIHASICTILPVNFFSVSFVLVPVAFFTFHEVHFGRRSGRSDRFERELGDDDGAGCTPSEREGKEGKWRTTCAYIMDLNGVGV